MSIGKRIQQLETRVEKADNGPEERDYWEVTLYLKAVENHQRKQQGLPPILLTPEEEEWERGLDEEFLQDGLPGMRSSPGWQSAEAQAQLDEWEHDIRQKYLKERS